MYLAIRHFHFNKTMRKLGPGSGPICVSSLYMLLTAETINQANNSMKSSWSVQLSNQWKKSVKLVIRHLRKLVKKSVKLVIRHLRKPKQIVGLRFSFTYLCILHRDIKQKQLEMCIWLLFPAILSGWRCHTTWK